MKERYSEYPKDLTGLTFGELKVIEYMGNSLWKCVCSCKEIRIISRGNLTSGNSTSCGHDSNKDKLLDLTGEVFGDLTVIEYSKEQKKWLCECSCGNKVYYRSWDLRNNRATKCKDWSKHINKRLDDLKGQTFGELTALEYLGDSTWLCECSCGNKCEVKASVLKDSRRKLDCGHSINQNKVIDLRGQQFGKLTAIEYMGNSIWKCMCSCGNTEPIFTSSSSLRDGSKTSCGCDHKSSLIELTARSDGTLRRHLGSEYNLYIEVDNHISSQEQEIYDYIQSIYNGEVIQSERSILHGKEIDIYIPELKLGIEFNGTYWHSDLVRDKKYHQFKAIEASKLGIRLIQIYEYEWVNNKDKIKAFINNVICRKNIKYARKLEIREIEDVKLKSEFLNKYHLQNDIGSSINIGLFEGNELIEIMTFGKPRFTSEYDVEILRMCTKFGVIVVGGAERILKYYLNKYKPKSLITYLNIDKFTGEAYRRLGMTMLNMTEPSYVWANSRANKVLSRFQTQKYKLMELGLCDETETEDEVMRSLHYLKIYNSGNLVYVINNT